MEIVFVVLALIVGLVVGRMTGRGGGMEEGRRLGLAEGRASGLSEGKEKGLDEGRALGASEGRTAALAEGRAAGYQEGLEAGRAEGGEEGRTQGLAEGRAQAEAEAADRLGRIIDAVERGRAPEGIAPDSAEGRLQAALERGWAPRGVEREAALREAIERVSAYLTTRVRGPLGAAGPDSDADELREHIAHALGALEDLDYFVSEMSEVSEGTNLGDLAQGVSREFASDQEIPVRLAMSAAQIRAEVNPPALMDALYLVLHNAGRFGGGNTIDLTVDETDGRARIVVRDRGDGFDEEAFSRAFDPFYSTSDEGLGLGLPHARKVVERMGGRIELRNVPDGGAEVEISFPTG